MLKLDDIDNIPTGILRWLINYVEQEHRRRYYRQIYGHMVDHFLSNEPNFNINEKLKTLHEEETSQTDEVYQDQPQDCDRG